MATFACRRGFLRSRRAGLAILLTCAPAFAQTDTGRILGTVSDKTGAVVVNALPLNGRNFMTLLQLRPGGMAFPGGGKWSQSSNGLRPEYNVYILNGIDAIEGFSAQSALNAAGISGDTASLLPVDAIQEFNVQHNPKATYRRKPAPHSHIGLQT